MPRKIHSYLLIETGAPAPEIVAAHGDYGVRFFEAFASARHRVTRVAPFRGDSVPELGGFDGVLVTGSPLSVCAPEPWMMPLAERLADHAERGGAILAVCFGLQLMAAARGAPVILNPRGREIGTIEIELTAEGRADPLFEGFPERFAVQATHTDVASRVPEGAALLASNANSPIQALRFGARAWGTQFHPEFDTGLMKGIIRSRRERLAQEGLDADALERAVTETPWGPRLLERFMAQVDAI